MLAARVENIEPRPGLGRVLDEGRRHWVVHRRVCADDDDRFSVAAFGERRRDGTGADVLEQRGNRRGVAEPRAVVDIVRPEAGADKLLDKIGLFVGALRRTEAGHCRRAMRVAHLGQPSGGEVECFFPACFTEMRQRVCRVERHGGQFRHILTADERGPEAFRIVNVIKAVTAFHAESRLVGRPLAARDGDNRVILDREGQLAADTAIGTDGVDLPVRGDGKSLGAVQKRLRHQSAGRTCLHAFAAADAGRGAHIVVEVEYDARIGPTTGKADDVIHLNLSAGTHAQIALDACIHVDGDRRMAVVGDGGRLGREARRLDLLRLGIAPQLGLRIMRCLARGLVGDKKFHHHFPCVFRAMVVAVHDHPFDWCPDATCREYTFALDLDHAGPAIAVGAVTLAVAVAKMRDVGAMSCRSLPDGLALAGLDHAAVEGESDASGGAVDSGFAHDRFASISSGK